mmetsp:Transcript_26788/g.64273  ORF Transcript_26788/g.64273 Transcript_26788/m.64273 type:complete len:1395 (+) Transcript_26788:24-4208(+)
MAQSTISLPDWIQRARVFLSKKDYLECAIIIASELTSHLVHVVNDEHLNASFSSMDSSHSFSKGPRGSHHVGQPVSELPGIRKGVDSSSNDPSIDSKPPPWESTGGCHLPSLIVVQIEDIVLKNVRVSVERAKTKNSKMPLLAEFRASDVKIQPSTSYSELDDIFAIPQLSQQDVCFALGKLFFDLFSECESSLLADIESKNNEKSVGDLQIEDIGPSEEKNSTPTDYGRIDLNDEHDDDFQAVKRALLSSNDPTVSQPTKAIQANDYLQARNLPLSICRLISDLLGAEKGDPYTPDTALLSLEEVKHDLMHMISSPERFLYDSVCPRQALDKTCLFSHVDGKLYGRENELGILMNMVEHISPHGPTSQRKEFSYEAAFLGGHSGSGKSSIIKRVVSHWKVNGWSMVFCKFDRQTSPLSTLLLAFDAFFGQFIPNQVDGINLGRNLQHAVDRISSSIVNSIDSDSVHQLCELLPSFRRLFPSAMHYVKHNSICSIQNGSFAQHSNIGASCMNGTSQTVNTSSPGNVGSGRHRLLNLFQILFKEICCTGHPVLICVEDLQWADEFTMDIIVQSVRSNSAMSEVEYARGGMLLLGSFRDNEVPEDGFLIGKIKLLEPSVNVTMLSISELPLQDVDYLLSFKFCVPKRYTRDLAHLVYQKTRGNPIFVIEFIRSIIQRNLVTFSVKSRRWTWDDTTIDLQMISEGVVEFLTKKLKQLPSDVIEALKVISCFGQVNVSTIHLLGFVDFVPNMLESLESAVKEGIVERSGPIFAFCHDMLQESTYSIIPPNERKPLHKMIGMNLVIQDPQNANNPELCTLAVDQINICKDVDGILNHAERAFVASLNLTAGKHSMSTKKSNFQQAGGYFETGISLLYADNWTKQYKLSLELYERSVAVSFMDGKIKTVPKRVDEIISNARSFSDTLNARALLAKFLASQERYADATNEVLEILSCLGESFPKEITTSLIMNEINEITPMLEGITKDTFLNLPTMTDRTKLQAMKFMDLLTSLSIFSSPMLMNLVSFRMTRLTFSCGYSDQYSIPGLMFMAQGLEKYSDDNIWLATQLTRVAESLMKDNPNAHALRARLAFMMGSVLLFVEPFQSVVEKLMDGYNSATIVGDVDNAMNCGLSYWGLMMFITSDLMEGQKELCNFVHRMFERKRIGFLHSAMSYFDGYTALIGNEDSCSINAGIEMKTNKQLKQIAEQTQNSFLMHQVTVNQMYIHCYYREYLSCASLAENYHIIQTAKRTLDFMVIFFLGISALNLARASKEDKWRTIGEGAMESMERLVDCSTWNFENKHILLQAELYYLDGRNKMAKLAYQASISSAGDHKFVQDQSLACELYGIFLVENEEAEGGLEQLQIAHDKYKQWGALKKATDVMNFMNMIKSASMSFGPSLF